MEKLRRVLRGEDNSEQDEASIITQVNDLSTLSWSTRIQGFCICFVIGIILSLLGAIALIFSNLRGFAILYTIGNVVSILSTCFLSGPVNQLKRMFNSSRYIATIIVIVSFVLTLISALVLRKSGLTLICIIIQSLGMTWYSLSYIPYARDAVKKTFSACIDV